MGRKWGKSAALVWILAGAVCVGASFLVGDRYDWEPLSQAIALTPGPIETTQFKTDRNGYYEIAVDIDKASTLDNPGCLLGVDPSQDPDGCKGTPSVVDISWAVTSSGEAVARGESSEVNEVYTADRMGRVIGEFWGQRGGRYAVALTVRKDGTVLDTAHPMLVVKVNEEESNNYAIYSQVLFFGGVSFGFVGLVLLLNASARFSPQKEPPQPEIPSQDKALPFRYKDLPLTRFKDP